jgi:hypothetical protein
MRHELKTWSVYFQAVRDGRKTFEVRKHDRPFEVGDILLLLCYDPIGQEYSGASCEVVVRYILEGGKFGIEPGYCVMGIEKLGKIKNKESGNE